MHLGLGTRFRILETDPVDGLITIRVSGQKFVLGKSVASRIIVQKLEEGE
jgi:Fe2+ transport system protein FeoA